MPVQCELHFYALLSYPLFHLSCDFCPESSEVMQMQFPAPGPAVLQSIIDTDISLLSVSWRCSEPWLQALNLRPLSPHLPLLSSQSISDNWRCSVTMSCSVLRTRCCVLSSGGLGRRGRHYGALTPGIFGQNISHPFLVNCLCL